MICFPLLPRLLRRSARALMAGLCRRATRAGMYSRLRRKPEPMREMGVGPRCSPDWSGRGVTPAKAATALALRNSSGSPSSPNSRAAVVILDGLQRTANFLFDVTQHGVDRVL